MKTPRPSRVRHRLAIAFVAGGLILVPFGLGSQSASAFTCESEIDKGCTLTATIICKVAAKGKPCLN
jgi:hypothetical protein